MRRLFGLLGVGVLLAALRSGAAVAATVPTVAVSALGVRSSDFSTRVFEQLFGESSDHHASIVAELGDRFGESPLRRYALRVVQSEGPNSAATPVRLADNGNRIYRLAQLPQPLLTLSDVTAEVPPPKRIKAPSAKSSAPAPSLQAPLVGYYKATFPESNADSADLSLPQSAEPKSSEPAAVATPVPAQRAPEERSATSPPVKVGPVQLRTHMEGIQSQSSSASDQALGGGATFNVRAGSRQAAVDLSSRFEHVTLTSPAQSGSSFDATANWATGSDGVPMLVPAYADVNRQTLSAGLAVPVLRNLTAGLQYDTQHLFGGYGLGGTSPVDARNDIYGAQLTFQLPHSDSAAISLSAKQYRYQDNILPQSAFIETAAGVNFTVKF
jgi:hypothetical protein